MDELQQEKIDRFNRRMAVFDKLSNGVPDAIGCLIADAVITFLLVGLMLLGYWLG